MTFHYFNALTGAGQLETVWLKGVLLASVSDEEYEYELYQVGNFYVEFKNRIGNPDYTQWITFRTTNLLDRYLEEIDISNLLAEIK